MEKEKISNLLLQVKEILIKILPETRDHLSVRETLNKKCFELGTLREQNIDGTNFHFCFCLFFAKEDRFTPSIFCSFDKDHKSYDPGGPILVSTRDSLEAGVREYVEKTQVSEFIKKNFLREEVAT